MTLPVSDLERSVAFYRAALVRGMGWVQLERFHREGLAAGGRDNGAPGPRPQYSPGYYGAFLLDPDGHNVEAVWHSETAS
jgi:catechol 2,3-dioxygenase-like lactoylglutathione lyase family enzyme